MAAPRSDGGWRLKVDCHGLKEVMLHSSVSRNLRQPGGMAQLVLPMRAPSLGQLSAGHRLLSCGGVSMHLELTNPAFCHGLIQAALEQGEAPEYPPYTDNIVLGNTAEEMFEKGKE